jgi:hypothetical protein
VGPEGVVDALLTALYLDDLVAVPDRVRGVEQDVV